MENPQGGIVQRTHPQSLEISDSRKRIAKVIVDVNQIMQYPLTAVQVLEWAESIERLVPDVDVMALAYLMDAFKLELIEWDRQKGIQNIFAGLKRVRKTDTGYEIFTPHTW